MYLIGSQLNYTMDTHSTISSYISERPSTAVLKKQQGSGRLSGATSFLSNCFRGAKIDSLAEEEYHMERRKEAFREDAIDREEALMEALKNVKKSQQQQQQESGDEVDQGKPQIQHKTSRFSIFGFRSKSRENVLGSDEDLEAKPTSKKSGGYKNKAKSMDALNVKDRGGISAGSKMVGWGSRFSFFGKSKEKLHHNQKEVKSTEDMTSGLNVDVDSTGSGAGSVVDAVTTVVESTRQMSTAKSESDIPLNLNLVVQQPGTVSPTLDTTQNVEEKESKQMSDSTSKATSEEPIYTKLEKKKPPSLLPKPSKLALNLESKPPKSGGGATPKKSPMAAPDRRISSPIQMYTSEPRPLQTMTAAEKV